MVDRLADIWGQTTPHARAEPWPVRIDERIADGQSTDGVTWTQSACVLCSNGCRLDIAVRDGRMVGVCGRADDRVNHGRLGPKGLHGWLGNAATDRLIEPLIRDQGELRPAT
jgi:ferredoxin-nitrate reductase